MKKPTFFVFFGALMFVFFAFNQASACWECEPQSPPPPPPIPQFCADQRIIYAQDRPGITPGHDNDTAIINDRNGNRLITLNQINDNYVIWPSTYTVQLLNGDKFYSNGLGSVSVTVNGVGATSQNVTFGTSGPAVFGPLTQDGSVVFASGSQPTQHGILAVCPGTNPQPQPQPPVYNPPVYNPPVYNPPVYEAPTYYYQTPYYYPQQYCQAPVWLPNSNQTVSVGRVLQFTVSAYNAQSYQIGTMPVGASFNSDTRMFMWTPSANQAGVHTIIFIASNGCQRADMSVSVNVVNVNVVNDTPPPQACFTPTFVAGGTSASVREGDVYSTTLQTNGGGITYRVISGPSGLTINPNFGIVVWVPDHNQGRSEPYLVTIGATNCQGEVTRTFYINVIDVDAYTPPVYEQPVCTGKLEISDIRVDQYRGNVIVSWNTNKPSTSGLMYDLISKADLTKNFNYAVSAPIDYNLVTQHQVNLGRLNANATHYFRVASQTDCDGLVISSERSLVPIYWSWFGFCWFWVLMSFFLLGALIALVVFKVFKKRQVITNPS